MMKQTMMIYLLLAVFCQKAMAQSGKTTYEYDQLNRLVRVLSPAGETLYTYDAVGNRKSKKFTPNSALKTAAPAAAPAVPAVSPAAAPADSTALRLQANAPENRKALATKDEESETVK